MSAGPERRLPDCIHCGRELKEKKDSQVFLSCQGEPETRLEKMFDRFGISRRHPPYLISKKFITRR